MPLPGAWFDDWFETAFYRILRLEVLEGDPDALLAVGPGRHWGRPVCLADGTTLRHGDPLVEFHLRRQPLAALATDPDPCRLGIGLYRLLKRDLPRLAEWLEGHPRYRKARALHAISLFHYGAPRVGFEVTDLPTALSRWWYTAWQRGILRRSHPRGEQRLIRHRKEPVICRQVWMSRARLWQLWGPEGELRRLLAERGG